MDFYDRDTETYNQFTDIPDPKITAPRMCIQGGISFWVIKFATVTLYLNMIIGRRHNRRAGKMEPPNVPKAARYCRCRKIVLIHLYSTVDINAQIRIFANIP